MKLYAALLPMLGLALIGFGGQTNQVELHQTTPLPPPSPPSGEKSALPGDTRTNAVVRFFRDEKNYDGVLPELRRQRVQFFRANPPSSKVPFHNVSVNPITGQAEGIVLFSVKF